MSVVFPCDDTMIVDSVGGWVWGDDCQDALRGALVDLICVRERCCFVNGVVVSDNQVGREQIPTV